MEQDDDKGEGAPTGIAAGVLIASVAVVGVILFGELAARRVNDERLEEGGRELESAASALRVGRSYYREGGDAYARSIAPPLNAARNAVQYMRGWGGKGWLTRSAENERKSGRRWW